MDSKQKVLSIDKIIRESFENTFNVKFTRIDDFNHIYKMDNRMTGIEKLIEVGKYMDFYTNFDVITRDIIDGKIKTKNDFKNYDENQRITSVLCAKKKISLLDSLEIEYKKNISPKEKLLILKILRTDVNKLDIINKIY